MVPEKNLIGILTGPTATGKSALAIEFAEKYEKIELINADSLLVYRGMNIGTAKPSPQELARVPHHLIDILDPDQQFAAADFARKAQFLIEEIEKRGNRALIVGGTGFYLKALLFGIWDAPPTDLSLRKELELEANEALFQKLEKVDSASALRIGVSDRYRLVRALEIFRLSGKTPTELENESRKEADPRFRVWILDRPTPDLNLRIQKRTKQMLQKGLVQEFEEIQARYPDSRALKAIGYAQVRDFLSGIAPEGRRVKPGLEGLSEEIQLATRQLVKQQRTWYRGMTRRISGAKWFTLDEDRVQLEDQFKAVYESD